MNISSFWCNVLLCMFFALTIYFGWFWPIKLLFILKQFWATTRWHFLIQLPYGVGVIRLYSFCNKLYLTQLKCDYTKYNCMILCSCYFLLTMFSRNINYCCWKWRWKTREATIELPQCSDGMYDQSVKLLFHSLSIKTHFLPSVVEADKNYRVSNLANLFHSFCLSN